MSNGALPTAPGSGNGLSQVQLNEQLIYAVNNGNIDAVNLLLEKGADVNVNAIFQYDVHTVLTIAVYNGRMEIVKALLEKGADVNAISRYHGNTALIKAANNGRMEIVKALLEKGADVNSINRSGETALLQAAQCKYGATEIVKALLEKGADVNASSRHGYTALMRAAIHGCEDTVKVLLDNGAKVYLENNISEKTAYDLAVDKNHKEIANMLKEPTTSIMPKYRTHKDITQDAFSQNPPTRPGEDNAYRLNNLNQNAPPKTSHLPNLSLYKTPKKVGTMRRNRNRRRSTRRRQ
jgi:ankyrin repeat protein